MSETTPPGSWPGLGEHGESVLGPDPLKTARDLQGALEGMTKQLAAVKKTVRRGKLIIIGLVASLIIDAGVTALVAVATDQAHNASVQAKATVGELCQSGNVARKQALGNWVYALDHLGLSRTAAGRKFESDYEAHLRKVYAPRNCSHLPKVTGGTS